MVPDRCHARCASCVMPARCCGPPACVPPCRVVPTRSLLLRPPLAIILLPPLCASPAQGMACCMQARSRDSVVLHYLAPQPTRNVSCLITHLLPQVHCGGASQLLDALHVLTACCESPANDRIPQLQLLPQVRVGALQLLSAIHTLTAWCCTPIPTLVLVLLCSR